MPSRRQRLYERWMTLVRAMARVQTFVLVSVLYWIVFPVFAVVVRRKDPLRLRPPAEVDETFWVVRPQRPGGWERYRRQF